MSTKEILIKAKNILEERGWCQNRYNHPDGRVCLSEAIQQAGGAKQLGNYYFMPAGSEVETAHFFVSDLLGAQVYKWNDDPARTEKQVVALLDRAIATCGE